MSGGVLAAIRHVRYHMVPMSRLLVSGPEYSKRTSRKLISVEQYGKHRGLHRHHALTSTHIADIIESRFCNCLVQGRIMMRHELLAKELASSMYRTDYIVLETIPEDKLLVQATL